MDDYTVTEVTTWRSVFEVDRDFPFGGNQTAFPYIILSQVDGVYYYDSFRFRPSVRDDSYVFSTTADIGYHYVYDRAQGSWVREDQESGRRRVISLDDVVAQNCIESDAHFYTTDQFLSGQVPAPVSHVLDVLYFDTPLDQVTLVLPVLLVTVVLFIALRKGISFLQSTLHRG